MSNLQHLSTRSLKRAYRAAFRRYNWNFRGHYHGLAKEFFEEMTRLSGEIDRRKVSRETDPFRHVSTRELKRGYVRMYQEYVYYAKTSFPTLAGHVEKKMKPLADELDKRGEKP